MLSLPSITAMQQTKEADVKVLAQCQGPGPMLHTDRGAQLLREMEEDGQRAWVPPERACSDSAPLQLPSPLPILTHFQRGEIYRFKKKNTWLRFLGFVQSLKKYGRSHQDEL